MSIFCSTCGSVNPEYSTFCRSCGSKLPQVLPTRLPNPKNAAALISPSGRALLDSKEVSIGRDPSNRLIINDPRVSWHHAVIRQCGDSYEVVDLRSFNGTFVNGQRLEGNITHLLQDGDVIRIGSTILRYVNSQTMPLATPLTPPQTMVTPPAFHIDEHIVGVGAPPPSMNDFGHTDALAPPPRWDHIYPTMVSPPFAAAPPVVFRSRRIFLAAISVALVLMVVILSLVVRNTPGGNSSPVSGFWNVLLFVCQIILLTAVICLIPTLVSWLLRPGGYAALVFVETAIFMAVFIGFGFWLFSSAVIGTWILYAAALVVLIEAGSHFVEWRKDTTLKRLKDGTLYKSIEADAEAIRKMARHEVALYVPVPVGLLLGTIIGLIRHQTELQIIEFCVQLVLFLAALVLLYFLIIGFLRMSDPLFRTIPKANPELAKRRGKRKRAAQAQPQSQEVLDQQYIDLVCDVSSLRTIYKYDALHNTILLVSFMLVVIRIWLVPIGLPWLIISLLLATLAFSEIPYAIGQYLLHNRILEQYTGGKYRDMAKKLQDYAPVFPPLPFLAALLTTGTAGGILYALLSQIAQNMLTTLIK